MSRLAGQFERLWKLHGGPALTKEVKFHPTRRWRWDFCNSRAMAAIEINGGVFVGGRHSRGMGQVNDAEKLREGTYLGWNCLTFTSRCLSSANIRRAIDWVMARIKDAKP